MTEESPRQCWRTPRELFEAIDDRYGPITLDVAADKDNAVVPSFFDREMNAMETPWVGGVAYCNPPYENIAAWVDRALIQVAEDRCRRVVMLLPSRTDQRWFHRVWRHPMCRIEFLAGRVQFGPPPGIKRSSNREGSLVLVIERPLR
jgi:phage N-6-adenine-methyltransferase